MSGEIINTYDQLMAAHKAGHTWPYAITREYVGQRTPYFSGWNVYHPFKATDPSLSTSLRRGLKKFRRSGFAVADRDGKAARLAAQQWVTDTYGYAGKWKRNGMGDYVPTDIAMAHPLRKRDT